MQQHHHQPQEHPHQRPVYVPVRPAPSTLPARSTCTEWNTCATRLNIIEAAFIFRSFATSSQAYCRKLFKAFRGELSCCACRYCRSKEHLTIDHVLPVSKGGKFTWSNCVTACRDCNMKKGSKTLAQIGWVPIRNPRVRAMHVLLLVLFGCCMLHALILLIHRSRVPESATWTESYCSLAWRGLGLRHVTDFFLKEPSHHELAPLRLVSANSTFEDLEPWKMYLMPWIKKSRASLASSM